MSCRLWVEGEPAPQGSNRAINDRAGNARLVAGGSDVGKVKLTAWRAAVSSEAYLWRHRHRTTAGLPRPLDGAMQCTMIFYLHRPPSVRREYPTVKPDLDKLVRATFDGITDGCLWVDDALVVHHSARKLYARTVTDTPVSPSGAPGCLIRLGPMRSMWEPQ